MKYSASGNVSIDDQFGSTSNSVCPDFEKILDGMCQAQLMHNSDVCGRTLQTLAHCYVGRCWKSGVAINSRDATEHQGILKNSKLHCHEHVKNVKQSHYKPRQALRVPGDWGSQTSRQSAREGSKVVSHTHGPPLPPRKYSWYSFLLEAESTPGP